MSVFAEVSVIGVLAGSPAKLDWTVSYSTDWLSILVSGYTIFYIFASFKYILNLFYIKYEIKF